MLTAHHTSRQRIPEAARQRQRGVAAIAAALLTVGVASATLGSYLLKRAKATQEDVQSQEQVALWADQSVRSFIATHGRLPCPALTSGGAEACGGFAKGWLPVSSLQGNAPDNVKQMDIRYMIYKGNGEPTDPDFSASEPRFVPALTDGAGVGGYPTGIVSSMDLCGNLLGMSGDVNRWGIAGKRPDSLWMFARGGNQTGGGLSRSTETPNKTSRPDRAHVVLAEGVTNVAYGIAVAAPGASGEGGSGVNTSMVLPRMESPLRRKDEGYGDIVSVTLPHELYNALSCDAAIASLDSVAVAQTWIDDALGFKQGNIRAGTAIGNIVAIGLVASAKHIAHDAIDLANGLYNFNDNVAKKATAEASIFLLPFVPIHVSGMADALAGQALNAVDMARSILSLGVTAGYMAAYYKLASDAEATVIWEGGRTMLEKAHAQGWAMERVEPVPPTATDGGAP